MRQRLSDRQALAKDKRTEDERWAAVITKAPESEDAFRYGVQTTRIYCRPTCTSRLPKRENVVFFDNWETAEGAGFRACKRCQPHTISPQQRQVEMIARICKQIETAEQSLSLSELATAAGFSPFHFQRLFKAIVGVTPKQYEQAKRARKVREELGRNKSITDAIHDAGFGASSSFYHYGNEILGMQPMRYQKGGQDITIRYGVKSSSLGWVLVAATDQGICTIQFWDDPAPAIAQLQERFSQAILANDPEFDRWMEDVIVSIETPQRAWNLPLDIQGTAFQQQVWQALRAIPPGQTATYTEIAQRLGNPKAVRAVARACASNEMAVAIPCHRVIGRNGSLTGYRWGLDRKQALLDRERG